MLSFESGISYQYTMFYAMREPMRAPLSVIAAALFLFGLGASGTFRKESPLRRASTNGDLFTIARETGFDFLPVSRSEQSFLQRILPEGRKHILRSMVFLRGGERIAAVYYYRSPDVPAHLHALKAWVYELFSRAMTRLVDETLAREGLVPVAILAFTDPALSEERFLFAQIHDSLYEFHFPEAQEGVVHGLLLELAREQEIP